MKRIMAALLLTAGFATAQDAEWETGIGQRDQVTKGLVSYWSMRNSGTTVFDEWGTNSGTATNGPVFAVSNGLVQTGGFFDGSDDYIEVAHAASLNFGTSDFTVSFWILKSTNGNQEVIGKGVSDENLNARFCVRVSSVPQMDLSDGTTRLILSATQTVNSASWRHIVTVYDRGANGSIYIDGALALSQSIAAVTGSINNTAALRMGRRGETLYGALSYLGLLDEVRIYNRALTSDEIKQLYRMGKVIYENR